MSGRKLDNDMATDIANIRGNMALTANYQGGAIPANTTTGFSAGVRQASGEAQAVLDAALTMDNTAMECLLKNTSVSAVTLWLANPAVDGSPVPGTGYPLLPDGSLTLKLRRMDSLEAICETTVSGAPYYYFVVGVRV